MVVRLERLAAKALEWILTVVLFKGFFLITSPGSVNYITIKKREQWFVSGGPDLPWTFGPLMTSDGPLRTVN